MEKNNISKKSCPVRKGIKNGFCRFVTWIKQPVVAKRLIYAFIFIAIICVVIGGVAFSISKK